MRSDKETCHFPTEAALCQAFLLYLPEEWIAYPETENWDILLVHRVGGWQIGIEAKQKLNAKVLLQATDRLSRSQGPDFRAILVGSGTSEMSAVAMRMGLTVITPQPMKRKHTYLAAPRWDYIGFQGPLAPQFTPALPEVEVLNSVGSWWSTGLREQWFDHFPERRHNLPDYVPDVAAGVPSPMILSDWKVKAMRVCIWVERNKTITRAHFRALGINPGRWMNGYWLKAGDSRGVWVAGPGFPADQIRREHPTIWPKVEADYDTWAAKLAP